MLKRLFYISATLFLLVATYTVAAHRVQAQSGGQVVGISQQGYGTTVVTSSGDVYVNSDGTGWRWTYTGNVFGGGTVNVQPQSWTGVKEKFRK